MTNLEKIDEKKHYYFYVANFMIYSKICSSLKEALLAFRNEYPTQEIMTIRVKGINNSITFKIKKNGSTKI